MKRKQFQHGLTLVELVVVMVLLLFIGLSIGGLVRSVKDVEQSVNKATETNQIGRIVLRYIVSELSSALPLPVPTDEAVVAAMPSEFPTSPEGQSSLPSVLTFYHEDAFDSVLGLDMDTLRFTTANADPRRTNTPQGDVVEVAYFVDTDPRTPEQGLVRSVGTLPGLLPEDAGVDQLPTEVVSERVVSLNFRFYDPDTGEWLDTWDDTDVLPALVEVRIGIAPLPVDEFLARANQDQSQLKFVEWFVTSVPIRVRSYPDPSVQRQAQQPQTSPIPFSAPQPPLGQQPSTSPSAPSTTVPSVPPLPPMPLTPQRPSMLWARPQPPPTLQRPSNQLPRPQLGQGQSPAQLLRPSSGTRPQGGGR
ncbi:MAG: hypothetical protein C4295_11250 [Candidatus Fervidibacterota bacterium]